MASLKFDITGDNASVLKAFRGVQDGVTQTAQIVEQQGASIENVFNRIKSVASLAFAGFTTKEIVGTLASVRGDFQQFEIAFETMLHSGEKAKAMISDLANLAATTPFDMKGVVAGAKQLLAYGFAADQITDTMRRLGDVSAGLGLNLQDLTWLYGTTMVQGRLFTRDLMQFTSRGIPMTEALAKQFGVTKDKVSELVTAGKIGFPEVEKAIKSMTDEGGQFGGLMEKQSKSITGQISNIQDTIEMAINDLGTQTEGMMNEALELTSVIVDHWKEVGEAILAAASSIGLYKAMAISVAAVNSATANIGYSAELSVLQELLPTKEEVKKSDLEEAVAKGELSSAQAQLVAAKREEVSAYVEELHAKAKAAKDNAKAAEDYVHSLENRLAAEENEVETLQEAYDNLSSYTDGITLETKESELNTAVCNRNATAKQLQAAREAASTAATEANTATTEANTAAQGMSTAATTRGTVAKGIHAQFTLLCKKAQDAWNASMFSSPLFWIAATIAGVAFAVYKLVTAETEHEAAVRRSNEAWSEFDQKVKERQQNIENLIRVIQSETTTEYGKAEAYQQLANIAPQLTEKYDQATLATLDFSKAQRDVAESIDEEKYQKAIDDVEKYKQKVKELFTGTPSSYAGSSSLAYLGGSYTSSALDKAKADLEEAEVKLSKIVELRNEAADNAKPIEIRLTEAEENAKVRQDIFDFYDEAMVLVSDWQNANETINYATGESRLDEFIAKAQKEVNDLREDIKKNPGDLNLRIKEEEKTKVLNGLLSMKQNWKVTGATTIPLVFKANWNTAKQELNKARAKASSLAKSGSSETYAQAYTKARKEYQNAMRKVAEIEKNKSKYTAIQYEKATADLKSKKDAYSRLGGDVNGKSTRAAETARKARAKEESKAIKVQEELNNRLKALRQKNTDETISLMEEGTEKKVAEIKNDYAKRKAEIDKQEAEFKKKNKEAGKKASLTSAQSDALSKARDLATQEYNKKLDEVNREALTSMRDYLKEYGSLYQQKQAIAEEYEEKIAKAQTEGEKLSLQQQRKKDLQTIEINAIRQNIDWGSIFGDFGAMFKDQQEPTIKKLQELSKSTTDVNEQKTIQELISKLQGSATIWNSDIFKKVSDDINSYQSAMQGYIDAQEREAEATKAVTKAQEDLAKAKKGGNKGSVSKAESNLSRAQNVLATASNNVLEFGSSVQKATSDLQTSAQKAVSQFQQLEDGLQGLTSGSLKGIGNSILGLDKLFGGTMQKDVANTLAKGIQGLLGKDSNAAKALTKALGDSGMAGEIISAVLGILDILKDGFGTLISNLMETVFSSVTGILDDALSGDIVMKPLKSIGDNVSHILNTLSFGGFDSWFGIGGNAKKVNDTIERLTDRNTLLQQSIEDLTDAMENSFGSKATSYYEQAYKNQQETNQNYLDIAKAQASYHSSHGSWNKYWGGFGSDEMDWIKKNVKADFNGDLFTLSPEEMKLLRGNVAIWEHIENTGKGNYGGRLTEKLNDYIDQAGKLEELSEQFKENLTQISFSGMRDSFLTDLMDMKKDGSDFASEMADDFAEKMQKALLSYSMEDLINGDLKKLYDDWAKAMKDKNGELTQEDVDAFYKRYDDIVQEGLKRRDEWAKVTGYTGSSSSQTATSGGWASVGQESVDELNGRFTALQISGESIAQNMEITIATMETILTLGMSTNGAVLEIRNMMIMTNSYLEDIARYSKLTYTDFGSKLDDMNNKLKNF